MHKHPHRRKFFVVNVKEIAGRSEARKFFPVFLHFLLNFKENWGAVTVFWKLANHNVRDCPLSNLKVDMGIVSSQSGVVFLIYMYIYF